MATITARVDDQVKTWLTIFAHEIGISVGSLFNAWAKHTLRTQAVSFQLDTDYREDQEMYANADKLRNDWEKSLQSGRSSLIL